MIFGRLAKLAVVGLAAISLVISSKVVQADHVVPKEMIDEINTKALWKAEESEFTRRDIEEVKSWMGTHLNKHHTLRANMILGKERGLRKVRNHYIQDGDCCLDGNCCHGMEYCCDECDGTCRCSVNGKCHSFEDVNDIKCDVCEFAIGWVESKLPINSTASEVEQLLEEVCNIVPKDFQAGCQGLVQNVAENIINAIIQKISPPSVCGMLGLCSSKVSVDNGLPDNFDGRQAFGKCVHPVRNQMKCGSCWAFSASEVLSDRFCIASKGAVDVVLSPQTLVSCDSGNMGCQGGYLDKAWEFMVSTGIASDACEPYTSGTGDSGTCPSKCADGSAIKYYKAANYQHLSGSMFKLNTVDTIRQELMTNGPVQVAFEVYQDFMAYKTGVYHHVSGSLLGGHAVELVGWGIDSASNMPYWLIKNSWDTTWGDQGYFKILRGKNECGIESEAYSGAVSLQSAFEVDDGIKCDLCMFVTKLAEQELAGDKSEAMIESVLEKACNILPKNAQPMCQGFIQAELPNLVNLIVNNFTPEKICSTIKAC